MAAKTVATVKARPLQLPAFVIAGLYDGRIQQVRLPLLALPSASLPALDTTFWVREVWDKVPVTACGKNIPHCIIPEDQHSMVIYRAGWDRVWGQNRSPMQLGERFSRMLLTVREATLAPLQEMTHADALKCGADALPDRPGYREDCLMARSAGKKPPLGDSPVQRYKRFWDGEYGKKYGVWNTAPDVAIIRFHVLKTDDFGKKEADRA